MRRTPIPQRLWYNSGPNTPIAHPYYNSPSTPIAHPYHTTAPVHALRRCAPIPQPQYTRRPPINPSRTRHTTAPVHPYHNPSTPVAHPYHSPSTRVAHPYHSPT
eukprot:1189196-Prorocentrum_minimum.AAC.1